MTVAYTPPNILRTCLQIRCIAVTKDHHIVGRWLKPTRRHFSAKAVVRVESLRAYGGTTEGYFR
jgi:hypothetical protein